MRYYFYFWFSLVPLFSVFLRAALPKKIIGIIGITAAVACAPILFGYQYIFGSIQKLAVFIILSCVTALILEKIEFKSGILFSMLVFVMMCLVLWPKVFGAGDLTLEKEWIVGNYKVEYFSDQGFAGRPSLYYKLSKYGVIPVFAKELETAFDEDSVANCIVRFPENRLIFDKCQVTIGEPQKP